MVKKRKRNPPKKVPFDRFGNMLRAARTTDSNISWEAGNKTILTTMQIHTYHTNNSNSITAWLVDQANGVKYPVFFADFFNMLTTASTVKNGCITGEWAFCKKGTSFGIYLVQEIVSND